MNIRVGPFNCQGLLHKKKKQFLIKDFLNYKLDVLCIQETHNKETDLKRLYQMKQERNLICLILVMVKSRQMV